MAKNRDAGPTPPRPAEAGAETATLLREVVAALSSSMGERFFHELVLNLSRILGVDYAFVGEVVPHRPDTIRTLAFCNHGRIAGNIDYRLETGTPCGDVACREVCYFPDDAQKLFPEDDLILRYGVEAFIGHPLLDCAGNVLGLLAVMHERPIPGREHIQSVLHICAGRATAELERARTEAALRKSEARLNEAQRIARLGSWELDLEKNELKWSDEIYHIFEFDPAEFGLSYEAFLDRIHPDDRELVDRAYAESVKNRTPYEIVHRLRMQDGRVKHVQERCESFYDGQGNPVRSVGTVQDITERRRVEEALIQSEANFRTLTENANVGILVNHRGRHVFANNRLLAMLGYSAEEIRDTGMKELVHPADYDKVMDRFRERMDGRPVPSVYETVFVTKDGLAVPVELTAARTLWQGEPSGLVFVLDIRERLRAEEQMRKLSSAVEQTADAVMITNRDGVIEYVNRAFEQTTGYSLVEALGKKPSLVQSGMQGEEFYRQVWGTLLRGETFRDVFINRKKGGELYYEEKTITPLKDTSGRITHFISTGKDITERIVAQERLQYLAHHDALTELPNRVLFMDRLSQALTRARWRGRVIGVMFLDLDRFKNLNDTLGHDVGDHFLQAMATRLKGAVREGDTVARFGGDEFAILLEDIAHAEDVSAIAGKMLQTFSTRFMLDEHEYYITASIGISLYPNDGADPATLLKHADTAMYRAKDLGKNNYQFYAADMSAMAFERLTLETSLRHALERREFVLYYQPQVEIASGRLLGMEALLRWRHPDFGLIGPLQFIHLAEETGLIVPIGEWVLRTACAQARAWETEGIRVPRLAINISGRQFSEPAFIDTTKRLFNEFGLQTTQVEFEITESVIMKDARLTADRLGLLYAAGIRFAIDDFGTGYSSLSYLKRFPISTLKIDKSFIHDVTTSEDDAEIVRTIIAMAHGLRLKVIAEGVETPEQLALLRAHGCDAVQGYYFSRPLPPEDLASWLGAGGSPGSGAQRVDGGQRQGQ